MEGCCCRPVETCLGECVRHESQAGMRNAVYRPTIEFLDVCFSFVCLIRRRLCILFYVIRTLLSVFLDFTSSLSFVVYLLSFPSTVIPSLDEPHFVQGILLCIIVYHVSPSQQPNRDTPCIFIGVRCRAQFIHMYYYHTRYLIFQTPAISDLLRTPIANLQMVAVQYPSYVGYV